MLWPTVIVAAYLLGSIPTAYIAGRLIKGVDIRRVGDGNVGAANAYRQLGAGAGWAVGVFDAAKGTLAVVIALAADAPQPVVLFSGAAAVAGHNWPIFLGFRGGRGESTAIGVLLAVVTKPVLVIAAPAIVAHFILRDTTKAAAFIFVPLPLVCWLLGLSGILIAYSIALPCLVGFTHFLRTRRLGAAQRRRSQAQNTRGGKV
ncbi:MAG: glycerol-3-phosphate acyltransferase [Dehalococcoidia bacterium]|jgi:glycerol-3-phosphate acyltransferase PlsY